MKDKDCIFCKIASGEIPSTTLYEDDDFRVILDLGPASKGHALIIPKEHYRNLYDIDDELAAKAIILAKKMVNKMKDVLGCDGYNIVQNNEEPAGQTVRREPQCRHTKIRQRAHGMRPFTTRTGRARK